MSGLRYAEQGPAKIDAISKRTTFIALFLPLILICCRDPKEKNNKINKQYSIMIDNCCTTSVRLFFSLRPEKILTVLKYSEIACV
jgi:hypothetical protein